MRRSSLNEGVGLHALSSSITAVFVRRHYDPITHAPTMLTKPPFISLLQTTCCVLSEVVSVISLGFPYELS